MNRFKDQQAIVYLMESGLAKLVKNVAEEAVQLTIADVITFLTEKNLAGAEALAEAYKKDRISKLVGQVGAPATDAATPKRSGGKKKKGDEQTKTVDLLKEETYLM